MRIWVRVKKMHSANSEKSREDLLLLIEQQNKMLADQAKTIKSLKGRSTKN